MNVLQGVGIDLNGFSGAGITTSLFIEFKAGRVGPLRQFESRSTVAAEFFAKLENTAIRIFDRPCVPALFVGEEREFAVGRAHHLTF